MLEQTPEQLAERYYTLLHQQLAARMPKPDGFHIYAKGNMYAGFKTEKLEDGWRIIISDGCDYARYVMGYNEDGTKRVARNSKSGLEKFNFATIDMCLNSISKIVASSQQGGVYLDGNKIY